MRLTQRHVTLTIGPWMTPDAEIANLTNLFSAQLFVTRTGKINSASEMEVSTSHVMRTKNVKVRVNN
jgi:hypothetical protein